MRWSYAICASIKCRSQQWVRRPKWWPVDKWLWQSSVSLQCGTSSLLNLRVIARDQAISICKVSIINEVPDCAPHITDTRNWQPRPRLAKVCLPLYRLQLKNSVPLSLLIIYNIIVNKKQIGLFTTFCLNAKFVIYCTGLCIWMNR